ncbi:hypothetical protein ElyMa_000642800 [Elysia marginata]|uniref:G-protein coupled receptors family 1 profile domain-containing protein n=1 Tax=Elysia marginata TaxID=1093978 RepID=A0AAV4GBV6_9GAST|nr:hypothetical protein ElyMa_000642800 [Elysia marginata]
MDKATKSNSQRALCKKNLHVFNLFVLVFGTYLITASPGIYYRALRPSLPPTLKTVAILLTLDVLPSFHYICTFVLLATKITVIRSGLEEFYKSFSRIVCCCFICAKAKIQSDDRLHPNDFIKNQGNQQLYPGQNLGNRQTVDTPLKVTS